MILNVFPLGKKAFIGKYDFSPETKIKFFFCNLCFFFATHLSDRNFSLAQTVVLVAPQARNTKFAIYIPEVPGCAYAWDMAKSKFVPSGGGWKSAERGRARDFSVNLGYGRGVALDVVAAREIFVKKVRCEGMHEDGTPPMEQGCGEGLFQHGYGLAGSCLG